MKYMQNTHDYYWLYGIICVNLQSLLAIAEWIEILLTDSQPLLVFVSASDSGVD